MGVQIDIGAVKPDIEKILAYGFVEQAERYVYSVDIAHGAFRMTVTLCRDSLCYNVFDTLTGEEYALVYVKSSSGSFVGGVRAECEHVIDDVLDKCFDRDIFKSDNARRIIEYMHRKYGTKAEYLWDRLPNACIFREGKSGKWYAAVMTVEKRKLGIDVDGRAEVMDLKERPENIPLIVDNKNYFLGYHMNKKHWYTLLLDGTLSFDEICKAVDKSYGIIKNNKNNKK